MAIHRPSIFGVGTALDATGECYIEPYSILGGSTFKHDIIRFGSNNAAQPTVEHGVYGQFPVPQNYVGAAEIVVIWTATLTTGNVVWNFIYRAVGGDDTESLDQGSQQAGLTVIEAAPGTAQFRLRTEIGGLTAGNFLAGDTVEFYLTRDGADAADTMAGSAILFDALFEFSD